jgi:hypothetical protein
LDDPEIKVRMDMEGRKEGKERKKERKQEGKKERRKKEVNKLNYARFEVFTAMKIQVMFFWIVMPCSGMVEYKRF